MVISEQLYTLGDVSRRLGVPRHRIVYLLESGRAQESLRLGGRRVFMEDDMAAIARALGIKCLAERKHQQAPCEPGLDERKN